MSKRPPFKLHKGPDTWETVIKWALEGAPDHLAWKLELEGLPQVHGKAVAEMLMNPPLRMKDNNAKFMPDMAEFIRGEFSRLRREGNSPEDAQAELGAAYHASPDVIRDVCEYRKSYKKPKGQKI